MQQQRELRDRRFRMSDGVQIKLEAGQVFNSVKELKSVLKDFIIQEGAWLDIKEERYGQSHYCV